MSWEHATLSSVCWSHEEVKNLARVFFAIVLNQSLVNNAARWGISQAALIIFHEKSLGDTLVNNNNSNLRF